MKTRLLIFIFALAAQVMSAQLNFKVLDKDGNPKEGVEIILYDVGWGAAGLHSTAANGVAAIPGLADGNYHFEIFHTETDGVKSQWGWGMNVVVAGTTDFEFTQGYPYHSGDNLASIVPNVGSASAIDFIVKNDDIMGEDIATVIEVWISKDKIESDFHFTMPYEDAVTITNLGEHTFNFDFTPALDGEYFWKAIIRGNADGKIWDSFDWTSAFLVGNVDQLNFKVLNSEGNPQEGVEITLYDAGWGLVSGSPFTTAANGIAGITELPDGNYHYEIYHTGIDGVKSQWGWGTNIAVAGTTDFEVTQNYPHYSGDNLSGLTLETGVASSIDFNVTNADVNGDDLNALIEVWISETMSESDFHYTMTIGELVNILNGTEHTFSFDFTPPNDGDFYWKAVVWTNGTTATDSFDWTSAFRVGELPPFNFKVLNGAGNPQEGVEVTLYDAGWGGVTGSPFVTAANGIAAIPDLEDGNYHYELHYTGTDGIKAQWGWGMDVAKAGATDFEISQNYPFYSGDNLAGLSANVGALSTIDFTINNNDPNGDDIAAVIEVWISKDQVETDFHYVMPYEDAVTVSNLGSHVFSFDFTPSAAGEHFWKAIVRGNADGKIWDSFDWTSAFSAGTLGVEDFALNNTVTVFPNPIVDNKVRFNLSTNDFIGGKVQLIDMTGRTIASKAINGNSEELNVKGNSSGLYFMRFTKNNKIATHKVIIK